MSNRHINERAERWVAGNRKTDLCKQESDEEMEGEEEEEGKGTQRENMPCVPVPTTHGACNRSALYTRTKKMNSFENDSNFTFSMSVNPSIENGIPSPAPQRLILIFVSLETPF